MFDWFLVKTLILNFSATPELTFFLGNPVPWSFYPINSTAIEYGSKENQFPDLKLLPRQIPKTKKNHLYCFVKTENFVC